jgi:hypothetical protein
VTHTMKNSARILLAGLFLGTHAVLAQSPITWEAPLTISSDADVEIQGTLFGAINNGGSSVFSVLVNGVTFKQFSTATNGEQTTVSLGHFSVSTTGVLDGLDLPGPSGAGVSENYAALLGDSSQTAGDPSSMTLTINDLAIGQSYLVQIWVNQSLGSTTGTVTLTASNSVSLRPNTSTALRGGRGQYVVGNFTAAAASEAIDVSGVGNPAIISAVQVRALSGAPGPGRLMNLSTRARVGTGEDAAIAGIIIQGQSTKKVIIRVLGPTLSQFGVAGLLADPVLDLVDHAGNPIAHNNDWRSTQEQEILYTNLAPPDDKESAIVATLQPGNYTAIVTGANANTGVALVEVYDLP